MQAVYKRYIPGSEFMSVVKRAEQRSGQAKTDLEFLRKELEIRL